MTNQINNMADRGGAAAGYKSVMLNLMRKYLMENRRMFLIGAGCYILFYVVLGILGKLVGFSMEGDSILFWSVWGGWVLLTVAISMLFSDMGRKESRIEVLMTPAGSWQKLCSRLLVVIPGTLVLIVLGYLALVFSLAVTGLLYQGVWRLDIGVCRELTFFWSGAGPEMFFFLLAFVLNLSFYLFGAVAWPRYSFLKSCLIQWGVSWILVIMALLVAGWTGYVHWGRNSILFSVWTMDALMLAASVAFVWGAERKLRYKTPNK